MDRFHCTCDRRHLSIDKDSHAQCSIKAEVRREAPFTVWDGWGEAGAEGRGREWGQGVGAVRECRLLGAVRANQTTSASPQRLSCASTRGSH